MFAGNRLQPKLLHHLLALLPGRKNRTANRHALSLRTKQKERTKDHALLVFFLGFFAVLAAALKALAVGAPGDPALRIRSPDPAFMRLRLLSMFSQRDIT
ncbi:MAG: hypothetical protein ACPHA6_12705 [Paracoccaceae bacterium]